MSCIQSNNFKAKLEMLSGILLVLGWWDCSAGSHYSKLYTEAAILYIIVFSYINVHTLYLQILLPTSNSNLLGVAGRGSMLFLG